ncbi:hypothetical protein BD626DRAFT_586175 [Schizophyllum amplum]|uniref:Uncharacterized protein n=1 Tax=Schizophyllum amplum TaxID=97359 RepID=A0A550C191_9AGAR|nr:hypothetical protein BD626DRAFT_586175 [Auriculariopsis ampla]
MRRQRVRLLAPLIKTSRRPTTHIIITLTPCRTDSMPQAYVHHSAPSCVPPDTQAYLPLSPPPARTRVSRSSTHQSHNPAHSLRPTSNEATRHPRHRPSRPTEVNIRYRRPEPTPDPEARRASVTGEHDHDLQAPDHQSQRDRNHRRPRPSAVHSFFKKTGSVFLSLLSMLLATGCAAGAGAVLMLVGKPLLDWVTASDTSQTSTATPPARPAPVAQSGAVGGALAFLIPCGIFLINEVVAPRDLMFGPARRRFENFVLDRWGARAKIQVWATIVADAAVYLLVSLFFAVGVGIWAGFLPLGMQGTHVDDDSTIAQTVVDGLKSSLLGWAVLHVGLAVVVVLALLARFIPRHFKG